MSEAHDHELVRATLGGDVEAFEQLVTRHERALFNAAYRITGNRDDAMDATQTAFVKAFEKLPSFDPAYRFFSWIFRIVVNESLNILGRRSRYAVLDSNDEPMAGARSPEEECESADESRRVHAALQQLKADLRVVVVLRHFHGLTYREMSAVIGIPEKTVKSRLFSARRNLRLLLLAGGFEP